MELVHKQKEDDEVITASEYETFSQKLDTYLTKCNAKLTNIASLTTEDEIDKFIQETLLSAEKEVRELYNSF